MANENLSISYSCSQNGVKATWKKRIENWDDVDAKVDSTWGSALELDGETFRIGLSTLPGRDWMVLSGVNIEFWNEKIAADDANGLPVCANGALLTMEFDTLTYNVINIGEGEAYLTHNIDSTINMLTAPNSALAWKAAGGDKVGRDEDTKWPVVMVQHILTWNNIYDPPMAYLYSGLGKINTLPFLAHAIGTVLFDKLSATYTLTTNLVKRYTLTIGCTARIIHSSPLEGGAVTWNHYLRSDALPTENPWQLLTYKSTGASNDRLLHSADLNELLTLYGYTHPLAQTVVA